MNRKIPTDEATIALVIPVYNEAPFLKRCLDSVVAQTKPFAEVIVVDDGSTDGSSAICDEYSDKFLVVHIENGGVSVARNMGMSLATTEYVTFLDSDDELLPEAHQKMQYALEAHAGADILQFNHLRHYKSIGKTVRKYANTGGVYDAGNLQTCQCWWGVWNKVIKIDPSPMFNPNLRYGEDGEFILKAILYGLKIVAINDTTVIHHFENHQSLTKTKTVEQLYELDQAYRELLEENAKKDTPWKFIKAIVDVIDSNHNSDTYKTFGWKDAE